MCVCACVLVSLLLMKPPVIQSWGFYPDDFNPNHLPEATPLNTIVGLRFCPLNTSHWGFNSSMCFNGATHIQTIVPAQTTILNCLHNISTGMPHKHLFWGGGGRISLCCLACLKFLGSRNPPASASWEAGTIGMLLTHLKMFKNRAIGPPFSILPLYKQLVHLLVLTILVNDTNTPTQPKIWVFNSPSSFNSSRTHAVLQLVLVSLFTYFQLSNFSSFSHSLPVQAT
jgi:hypothetical protein